MSDKQWKRDERAVAAVARTRRTPLSGRNSGHATSSDSLHPTLYFEVKSGKSAERLLRSPLLLARLFADTELKALRERKVAVVVLHPPRWGSGGPKNWPAYVRHPICLGTETRVEREAIVQLTLGQVVECVPHLGGGR